MGFFKGKTQDRHSSKSTGRIWQLLLENGKLQEDSEWLSLEQIWSLWGKKRKKKKNIEMYFFMLCIVQCKSCKIELLTEMTNLS